MATRLYLPASGSPPLPSLAVNSNWELTNGLVRLPCFTAKQNTALATDARTWPATITQQWCWRQYQSDILAEAYNWTTADTVSMVVGKCGEPSALTADTHLVYVVKIVSGDGALVRGNIGLLLTASTEFPNVASAATRIHSARVNGAATFSSQVGDRIIVEIGVQGVTPAAVQVQMRFGDPSATADFALTAGLTTDLDPWVELSRTVTFGAPPASLVVQDAALAIAIDALTLRRYAPSVAVGTTLDDLPDDAYANQEMIGPPHVIPCAGVGDVRYRLNIVSLPQGDHVDVLMAYVFPDGAVGTIEATFADVGFHEVGFWRTAPSGNGTFSARVTVVGTAEMRGGFFSVAQGEDVP